MESMIQYAPPPVGRDQARELARRELQKQIYHRDEPSFLDRVMRKISDWLNSVLDHAPGNHSGGSGSWAALIVLLILLVLIAAAVWWRIGNVRGNAAERQSLLDDTHTTAEDHRSAAERHAAAGEWPEAIRERLRAIARDLEERVIVEPRPGRTADELASEAGTALPDHAEELAAGVRIFDDVWYGGRTGNAEGYQRLTELDRRLRSARPAPLVPEATS
jgi:Flp pilus assembly protein TadB